MTKIYKNLTLIYLSPFVILLLSFSGFALSADTLYTVKKSDNLDRIVSLFYKNRSLDKAQIMNGIFVKNPEAFKYGNINDLKLGVELTLPDEDKITLYSNSSNDSERDVNSSSQNSSSDFSLSDLVRSIQASDAKQSAKEITASQKKQSIKIKQLERDGDALRKQLEQLLSDKKVRDKKLVDLEKAINESLAKKSESALVSTKSLAKEEQSDNTGKVIKNEKGLASVLSKELKDTDLKLVIQPNNTKVNDISNQVQGDIGEGREAKDKTNNQSFNLTNSNMLIWLLLPLLFVLAYFLKKSWSGGKRSSYTDYVDTVVTMPDNDVIDLSYAKQSLEGNIKLDVAKAYIEMNNDVAAREVLDDLVSQGDETISQHAKDLLEKI